MPKTTPIDTPTLVASDGPDEPFDEDVADAMLFVAVMEPALTPVPEVLVGVLVALCGSTLKPLTGMPKTVAVVEAIVVVAMLKLTADVLYEGLRYVRLSPGATRDVHCEGKACVFG